MDLDLWKITAVGEIFISHEMNAVFSENQKMAKIVYLVTSRNSHVFVILVQSLF